MLAHDVGELGGDAGSLQVAVAGGEAGEMAQVAEEQRHVDRVDEVFGQPVGSRQAHGRLRHHVLQPALVHAEEQRRHQRSQLAVHARDLGDGGSLVGAGRADGALDVGTEHLNLGRRHL